MSLLNGQHVSSRQAHLAGTALLAFAVVVGAVIALWEMNGASGYRDAAFAPFAISNPNARLENANVPHMAAGLVPNSSNQGLVLYGRYCDSCHPAGEAGIGVSLRDTQFKQEYTTAEHINKVVRSGGFSMPAFQPDLLPDDKLQEIAKHVLNLPQEGQ